jgi:two-component system response regulator FlrC
VADVLVVDDKQGMRDMLAAVLRDGGHVPTLCASGEEALAELEVRHFDLVITDLRMGGVGGMEILDATRRRSPETPIIMMTAYGSVAQAVEAMRLGAFDFVEKPLS